MKRFLIATAISNIIVIPLIIREIIMTEIPGGCAWFSCMWDVIWGM